MPAPKFFRTSTAVWQNGCESVLVPTINTPLPSPDAAPTRGIIYLTAGNLIVTMADGTTCTIIVAATSIGMFVPLAITMVNTSSTATCLAFY